MPDNEELSNQPNLELSNQPNLKVPITQKISIFFLMPIFIAIIGLIVYEKQLADPSIIATTGGIVLIIFLLTAYLYVRKLVKKQYETFLKMQFMAITDALTQLYTKTHFDSLFQNEMVRAKRYDRVFCCAVVEIDEYNKMKEKYGRQVSDEIFQDTAEILRDDLRATDIIARDSDRYICLLPETDIKPTMFVSKRLRSVIEGEKFDTGSEDGVINLTVSIGITEVKPSAGDELDVHEIIAIADKALVIAKEKGGNTIEFLKNKS